MMYAQFMFTCVKQALKTGILKKKKERLMNTLQITTIRCKNLATIISAPKCVKRPFFRRK